MIVGTHILSGNVFEPRALDELLPQWKQEGVGFLVPLLNCIGSVCTEHMFNVKPFAALFA